MFWKAYNQSAMRLCEHFLSYKVTVKYIKKVKQTVCYCGFPQQALEKIKAKALENNCGFNEEEKQVIISGLIDKNDYEKWKYQFRADEHILAVREPSAIYKTTEKTTTEMLIKKIREYPLENSTPMQTMLFVHNLKRQITAK